jgi:hypothetical protein
MNQYLAYEDKHLNSNGDENISHFSEKVTSSSSIETPLFASLRESLSLFIICALYMIGSDIFVYYVYQQHPEFDFHLLATIILYAMLFYFSSAISIAVFLLIYSIGYSIKNFHTKPFWWHFAVNFKNKFLTAQQIYGTIIIFFLMPIFFAYVVMNKQLIPFVNPFSWDQTFMRWDYVLHFHHHPWKLLQPIIGYPIITAFLSRIYGFWFVLLTATIIWQANTKERFYRTQFFITFLLSWIILGTILAIVLSSAGPCYYDTFSGTLNDPYASLMSYLSYNAPPWVLELQQSLLTNLLNKTLIFGGGVSAMPSLHISMATLCFLVSAKRNKWLGLITFAFLILILIASVHLAWHYAVDGYVSIILTYLIWYCTGKMIRISNVKMKLSS